MGKDCHNNYACDSVSSLIDLNSVLNECKSLASPLILVLIKIIEHCKIVILWNCFFCLNVYKTNVLMIFNIITIKYSRES